MRHSCTNERIQSDNRHCTSKLICELVLSTLRANLSLSIAQVQAMVKDMYHVDVGYTKAWKGKNKALKRIFGSWEQSYAELRMYFTALTISNPGTIIDFDSEWGPGWERLKRVFWSFGPSIIGFNSCHPVLSVDGTFLHGKYKGTLLMATGEDAEDHIFPYAFAIDEGENRESWLWFLHNVYKTLDPTRPICIISDRFRGNVNVVRDAFPPQYGHVHRCFGTKI
ncbi:uncharacterized protein LOC120275413 isoform X2 [Dioscorea cayenensis subsp. rotundata]|uniref:Uncharacterized protein LOC120275413 isoform X2 n=1 Tax=Dioscorea cayennensis subsp. rotundata TaxID=55577 RepID=A0AB40CGX4_DIOCR|nr:uncharacterized protein LOC120275413 isoform X2 [Dioscorea cayenensis subsp. rotundata]